MATDSAKKLVNVMSYRFGKRSLEVRKNLHPYLVLLVDELIKHVDVSLVSGLRDFKEQELLFGRGASKLRWPESKHNRTLDPLLESIETEKSDAVDIIPYPSGYEDVEQMVYVMGLLRALAFAKGIPIRCGLDWNGDGDLNNGAGEFYDVGHCELVF
jgi:peptidoglycan L-alanyl-D-glutamate endopeptidase CwlK